VQQKILGCNVNLKKSFKSVSMYTVFVLPDCHEWSATPISACLRPETTWLHSQWMLHWWRVSGSTARELLRRTHPSTSRTKLDNPQIPFFKSLGWSDREPNPP